MNRSSPPLAWESLTPSSDTTASLSPAPTPGMSCLKGNIRTWPREVVWWVQGAALASLGYHPRCLQCDCSPWLLLRVGRQTQRVSATESTHLFHGSVSLCCLSEVLPRDHGQSSPRSMMIQETGPLTSIPRAVTSELQLWAVNLHFQSATKLNATAIGTQSYP